MQLESKSRTNPGALTPKPAILTGSLLSGVIVQLPQDRCRQRILLSAQDGRALCFREAREGFLRERGRISTISDYNGTRIPEYLDIMLSQEFYSVSSFPSFLACLTAIYSENATKHYSLQETFSDFHWLGQAPLLCALIMYTFLCMSYKYWFLCLPTVTGLWILWMLEPCLSY